MKEVILVAGILQNFRSFLPIGWFLIACGTSYSQGIDKQQILKSFSFWDNQDWNWYIDNIPFLETPDRELDATYYYRWEVVTKHRTYGSPKSGYSFTEFIDRPFWSGAYGAISCPAGHQLYEVRWLRNADYARDYARYWFRTPGAQPRNYSTWLADSVWAIYQVHGDPTFATDLLADLVRNFAGWEERHYAPQVGLFWQTGHDDGMEFNINSRQTQDILRGAPSFRPSFNAYMYADAIAISRIARLAGDEPLAREFSEKAAGIKTRMQDLLWDANRQFFFPMFRDDEQRDGHTIKAGTLTYQSGQFAGNSHGRELIGYVPWQFNLPDQGFEDAWDFLMDDRFFAAPYGPTVVERNDPMFLVTDHCCWWSGQSWPYATTQTLVAMANLLNDYDQQKVDRKGYFELLKKYALTHRKDGRPYIAEAVNPDTGSWKGYDNYNHSEHYFHSAFCDLVISGLIGIRPHGDDKITVNPLVPDTWDYFAIVDVPYHGRSVSCYWDRDGTRYGLGAGLQLWIDGQKAAASRSLEKLELDLSPYPRANRQPERSEFNFAVNNDGGFFPALRTSSIGPGVSPNVLQDGNYWYHLSPPNRWTTEGVDGRAHVLEIDFGTPRIIDHAVLYPLHDEPAVLPPSTIEIQSKQEQGYVPVKMIRQSHLQPTGRTANHFWFEPLLTQHLRVVLGAADGAAVGLTEIEMWGKPGPHGLEHPRRPPNRATRLPDQNFPRATASYTSRYDQLEHVHDGVISYRPSPHNRWTCYESPSSTDWLEIDFGKATEFRRLELHLYDDRGGVQAPRSYAIQFLDNGVWRDVTELERSPEKPVGGAMNTARFRPVTSTKVRVVLEHAGGARSGLTEIEVWNDAG